MRQAACVTRTYANDGCKFGWEGFGRRAVEVAQAGCADLGSPSKRGITLLDEGLEIAIPPQCELVESRAFGLVLALGDCDARGFCDIEPVLEEEA
jgi:hypothetical protein